MNITVERLKEKERERKIGQETARDVLCSFKFQRLSNRSHEANPGLAGTPVTAASDTLN